MGLPVEVNPLFLENQYAIQRSLRFRQGSSNNAYLSRTFGTPTAQNTWTLSFWVKRGILSSGMEPFSAGTSNRLEIIFAANNTFQIADASTTFISTNNVFRDASSWYHFVIRANGSGSAFQVYVNGVLTSNATTNNLTTSYWNASGVTHYIGALGGFSSNYFDGYMAEINFVDGQSLAPTSFGQYNEFGVWSPRKYGGSYGNNGFYLPFTNPTAASPFPQEGNDSYTKCLLHGNSFDDSAWNGTTQHNLTAFGSATTSTTQSTLGIGRSLYTLGSSSQYFRTDASADFTYAAASGNTNDFTFDFWFYPGASGSQYPAFSIADTTYSSLINYTSAFYASSNNTSWDIANGRLLGTPTLGQWNHFAIVRSGSTWYTFLNGVQQDTWTSSLAGYNYTTNNFLQIGRIQGGGLYSTGYYQEARWSSGIARWTSNFTPPTVPYKGGFGTDYSSNTNPFRPFNTSVTTGTTYDAMTDVPTPSTIQNVAAGNYAVINPIDVSPSTVANGNLTISYATNTDTNRAATFGVNSGKWYWETTITAVGGTYSIVGITSGASTATALGSASYQYSYISSTGNKFNNGSAVAYGATYTTGNVIGIALDMDAGTLVFYKDNTSQGTAYTGLSGTFFPAFNARSSSSNDANFGQRPFANTTAWATLQSSGFRPLNTNNLPSPTIPNGARVMAATTYAGTSSSNPVSNSSNNTLGTTFQPDFVWIKNRNYGAGTNHVLIDSVRGISNGLASNLTNGDFSTTGNFSSINPTGFTVAGTARDYNFLNDTFVGWQWSAGSGASTVPSGGSITPTGASINVSAGFSIIAYTGTGSNATVPHGLGATPAFIMIKDRTSATNGGAVYHTNMGATKFLKLFQTTTGSDGEATDNTVWNGGSPTFNSSVFSVGTNVRTNTTDNYIAYIWTPVSGYSAFGSYTGNGSPDGPFVYTGFRPRWIMGKASSAATSNWFIYDTSRATYNASTARLYADTSGAETTGLGVDILSNGFKFRASGGQGNDSGTTYIYAAFAETPFKFALAR